MYIKAFYIQHEAARHTDDGDGVEERLEEG